MNAIKKQILISLLFVLFLNLNFLGLYLIFYSQSITFLGSFIYTLILLCLLNAFFVFFVLSFLEPIIHNDKKIKESLVRFLIIFIGSFPIFFWFGFNIYSALAFFFFLLFLMLTSRAINKEKVSSLKFRFGRIFKSSKWIFLTGFAILIAFVAFLSPKILGGKIQLPRSLYDAVFLDIEERLASQYPGFSGEMTVNEFVLLVSLQNPPKDSPIEKAKEEIKTYPDFKKFSKELQQKVDKEEMDKFLAQGRKETLRILGFDQLGIEAKGNEKMKDVFYKAASSWLESRASLYQYVVGIIAGLILFFFFIARFILSLAGLFYLPVAWLIFKLLKKINFFRLEEEEVVREKITI